MNKPNSTTSPQEVFNHQHLLCWKSVFGGLLISVMAFTLLTALGAGIGGLTASSLISNDEGGAGLATGAGLWLGITATISLFLGSYFALRISSYVTNKVGAAHGFVVASLFFILLIWGAGSGLSKSIGKMSSMLGSGAAQMAASPMLEDTLLSSFGGTNLKSSPQIVTQGLAIRLLQGDTESAKAYYAYQTGLSQTEVDARFAHLKNDFEVKSRIAAEKAANGIADAGWSLFVSFIVGLFAAVMGGRTGAQANRERPIAAKSQPEVYRGELATNMNI